MNLDTTLGIHPKATAILALVADAMSSVEPKLREA